MAFFGLGDWRMLGPRSRMSAVVMAAIAIRSEANRGDDLGHDDALPTHVPQIALAVLLVGVPALAGSSSSAFFVYLLRGRFSLAWYSQAAKDKL
ncbi:hypothetical protein QBC37DRAFT_379753, partial [Rhypophila decipiens]